MLPSHEKDPALHLHPIALQNGPPRPQRRPSTMALHPDGADSQAADHAHMKPAPGAHSLLSAGLKAEPLAPDAAGLRDAPQRAPAATRAGTQPHRSAFTFVKAKGGTEQPARCAGHTDAWVGSAASTIPAAVSTAPSTTAAASAAATVGHAEPKWRLVHRVTPELADAWSDARCSSASQPDATRVR